MINIVVSNKNLNIFNKSKYMKIDLGMSSTISDRSGRVFNTQDDFAVKYNSAYRTTLYKQCKIGNISVYTDYYIKNDDIAIYYSKAHDEYLYNIDFNIIKEKGIDFFIGHLIEKIEDKRKNEEDKRKNINTISNNDDNSEKNNNENNNIGDANKVFTNPGNVRYEDYVAYMKKKKNII